MPMATDALVRKAITLTSNLTSIIPQLWAAELERNLRKRAVLQQSLVVNTDLLAPGAGNTVYIPILPDIAAASQLTEGTDMTDIALSNATSVALTPVEWGTSVGISRYALDRIKYDGVAAIIDRLGYAMSLAIEGKIAGLWNVAVPGTASKFTPYIVNGKTNLNIASTDVANDDLLLQGKVLLEQANNVPFSDGMYRWYIAPAQYKALIQDSNIRQDLRFANAPVLLRGEVGSLHNVRIIVTNYITTQTMNAQTVYNSLLVAPRWAAVAYKRKPQVVVDPTVYDFGRRRRFGVLADFDIEPIHAERAIVLQSC
jgi:hypothetical protein